VIEHRKVIAWRPPLDHIASIAEVKVNSSRAASFSQQ